MKKLSDMEISLLINFNRQIYTSFKAMVLAVKDYFLNEKEADYFDELPGFIH
jgi:phosphate:Na+ symporter